MWQYLLTATAFIAIASPATAREDSLYVGVEGGALAPKDSIFHLVEELGTDNELIIDQKVGFDLDILAGYDFGMVRAEAELGWKRTSHDQYTNLRTTDTFDARGRTNVLSLMGNALVDFGDENALSFSAGGGLGVARTKIHLRGDETDDELTAKDSQFAWQLIAGARYAVTPQIDLGLKYRYFQTKLDKEDYLDDPTDPEDVNAKFRSHSILVSLIYNFAPPTR